MIFSVRWAYVPVLRPTVIYIFRAFFSAVRPLVLDLFPLLLWFSEADTYTPPPSKHRVLRTAITVCVIRQSPYSPYGNQRTVQNTYW